MRLLRLVASASRDHRLIEPDDRILACVSGGKDSLVMLHLLRLLQRRTPFRFEVVAVHLDQKQPGTSAAGLRAHLDGLGVPYEIVERDTWSIVQEKLRPGETYCALCARLRRGILYSTAVRLGCTKVAMGHHREDINETLLLNLFYAGQLKAMPPRVLSDDGENVLIRPLAYCPEAEIAALALDLALPVTPCGACSTQEGLKRKRVKAILAGLAAENPKIPGNMLTALGNVSASHLLDRRIRAAVGLDPVTGAPIRSQ